VGTIGLVSAAEERWLRMARSTPENLRRIAGALFVTLLGQALLLCGLFLLTRISATIFAPVGFGEYQVMRRTIAVLTFPLMCGLGVSLPRYIARNIGNAAEIARWLYATLAFAIALIGIFLALGAACSAEIGRWVFGSSSRNSLVFALLVASVGMLCATLSAAALRGLSRFRFAAVLQVVNGALAPLLGIVFCAGRVERAFHIAGILWVAIAIGIFIALCREWANPAISLPDVGKAVRELFVYGAPRVPGDMALFGLFALPAFAAVHRNDIVGAGFVSVGLSLVQATATVFASTGFVLLPYWSRAAKNPAGLRIAKKRIGYLLVASVIVATLSMTLLQILLHPIVSLLLGSLAGAASYDIRYIVLAAVPYVVYLVLRDYFDAISVFPMNTLALIAAIAIQAFLLSTSWLSIPAATAASFFALGALMTALWAVSLRVSSSVHQRELTLVRE
jgi:O-antigen/teichoic acid export membrane protein